MAVIDTVNQLKSGGPYIAAGIASANLMNLAAGVEAAEGAGLELLHFDVMDGRFCPQLTFGPSFVKGVKTRLLKDVHLMIAEPEATVDQYVAAGADIIVTNLEASRHIHRVLQVLGQMENVNDASRGIVRGVALNPGTPLAAIEPLVDDLEMVVLLAVNPGWGGQGFVPAVKDKLARLVEQVRASGRDILVGIDGGITAETIGEVAALGPDVIVAGSAIYKRGGPRANAEALQKTARDA